MLRIRADGQFHDVDPGNSLACSFRYRTTGLGTSIAIGMVLNA